MEYEQALRKAWSDISTLTEEKSFSIKFLLDEYKIDLNKRSILSTSCNVPAKDYESIILLHYLARRLKSKALPEPDGEWIGFRQLEGGDGYYTAFRKRTIDVILRKYGERPEALVEAASRLNGRDARIGDAGVIIDAFQAVPILITIWKGDEELTAGANIAFDKNISKIFCTEDIVVLTEIVAHSL